MESEKEEIIAAEPGGEEGGWETGDSKELLAKAHTPRGGDATDKVRSALSSGLS